MNCCYKYYRESRQVLSMPTYEKVQIQSLVYQIFVLSHVNVTSYSVMSLWKGLQTRQLVLERVSESGPFNIGKLWREQCLCL